MLVEYIQGALENAEYKRLENGTWFAEIPGFKGVWANGKTVEECRKELVDVLEEWLILKLRDADPVPLVKGYEISIKKVTSV
ncbi:MAG: type II toxin-antitoxin system HicB family antitoxin [Bacteriovoracaceae bacterium]|nr:type II toxin-antitoxin system HicB family antitoxin [Bacteriovoracaceae bacterium]